MALSEGQWQIRDLIMGAGTPYNVQRPTNPFKAAARAEQSDARPWAHGGWSGAEFEEPPTVPIRVMVNQSDVPSVVDAIHDLRAAFRAVGDAAVEEELRFALGGREYVMFGRPRIVDPGTDLLGVGKSRVRASFVALDPTIYSGIQSESTTTLPTFSGGLTVPFTVPFTIDATKSGGSLSLTNDGNREVGLDLEIDGLVREPRVVLQRSDGVTQQVRYPADVASGRTLSIDTKAKTADLDGAQQSGVLVWSDFTDGILLPSGTSSLEFRSARNDDPGQITARWRSGW